MKRFPLLLALLLLLTLSGCGKDPDPAPEDPAPLTHLDTLTVEISKNHLPTDRLMDAAKHLPELLQAYFAQALDGQGIVIDELTVTVGASPAATAQALAAGTVDLAFLPPEELLLHGGGAAVLAADAPHRAIGNDSLTPEDWNGVENATVLQTEEGPWMGGTYALICAAPTAYGAQLAGRVEGVSGEGLETAPTWDELNAARWGVLEKDALAGYRCLELWLADRYEGNTVSDLADVTVYDSEEALLRAAAGGEIDAFPLRADSRLDAAEAWTLPERLTTENGLAGFGRSAPVWEEVRCVGVTATLYATAAAVSPLRPELAESRFAQALDEALARLRQEEPERMEVLGADRMQAVAPDALAPMRRLLTIEGRVE